MGFRAHAKLDAGIVAVHQKCEYTKQKNLKPIGCKECFESIGPGWGRIGCMRYSPVHNTFFCSNSLSQIPEAVEIENYHEIR